MRELRSLGQRVVGVDAGTLAGRAAGRRVSAAAAPIVLTNRNMRMNACDALSLMPAQEA